MAMFSWRSNKYLEKFSTGPIYLISGENLIEDKADSYLRQVKYNSNIEMAEILYETKGGVLLTEFAYEENL